MYKTSVYTLVNGNIEELAHRKQQKSQKVMSASHWLGVSVLLNNITYAYCAGFSWNVLFAEWLEASGAQK